MYCMTKYVWRFPTFPAVFFVLGGPGTAYFVRPAQKIFMDARQSSQLIQMFVFVDPYDPCTRWRAMAVIAGATN
jgi:hypothetical protein